MVVMVTALKRGDWVEMNIGNIGNRSFLEGCPMHTNGFQWNSTFSIGIPFITALQWNGTQSFGIPLVNCMSL